jgi:hypothetical protein
LELLEERVSPRLEGDLVEAAEDNKTILGWCIAVLTLEFQRCYKIGVGAIVAGRKPGFGSRP